MYSYDSGSFARDVSTFILFPVKYVLVEWTLRTIFLLDCLIAFDYLCWSFNWCSIPIQRFLWISDFVNFPVLRGNCPKKRNIFLAICYGFL